MINKEENMVEKSNRTAIFSHVDLLKTILDFGWDINLVNNEEHTFITLLLRLHSVKPFPIYRETLELAIFHNPDVSLHKLAVYYGLKADLKLYELTLYVKDLEATYGPNAIDDEKEMYDMYGGSLDNHVGYFGYVMDGKLHGSFGHNGKNLSLNFMIPFLIECGFSVSTEDRAALEYPPEGSLHPEEIKYIKQYLASPRSLKQECRNVLRRHYTGRQLHRFVELLAIPQQIKHYLLLRPMLKFLGPSYI